MKAFTVDTAALQQNIQNLKDRAGDAEFWAVIKGNGYGLGLLLVKVSEKRGMGK